MLYSSACCKGQLVLTVVILVHSVLLLLGHIMLSKEHGSRPLLPASLCMGDKAVRACRMDLPGFCAVLLPNQ